MSACTIWSLLNSSTVTTRVICHVFWGPLVKAGYAQVLHTVLYTSNGQPVSCCLRSKFSQYSHDGCIFVEAESCKEQCRFAPGEPQFLVMFSEHELTNCMTFPLGRAVAGHKQTGMTILNLRQIILPPNLNDIFYVGYTRCFNSGSHHQERSLLLYCLNCV